MSIVIRFLLLPLLVGFGACSTPVVVPDPPPAPHAHSHHYSLETDTKAGPISVQEILTDYPAFKQVYENWSPSAEDLVAMQALAGKELVVIFGLWCGDSKREIPRLLKLLEQSGVALASLQLYTLDRQKVDPEGFGAEYRVEFVPTIIVKANGEELGRFVESAKSGSMALELAAIVRRS